RKSKAQEDNVEKPKKPRSAYLLYYFDVHQIMQKEIPNLPQSEINKRISKNWKRLSIAEKGYYLEKAKSEKDGTDTVSRISSLSPSLDLPGFRKILPRASYFLLSKGCSSHQQLVASQSEVSSDSGPPSISLPQEPPFTPLQLESEVELSEQQIVVDAIAGETEVASAEPQSVPFCLSSSVSCKAPSSTSTLMSQGCGGLVANGVTLKGNETRGTGFGYGGPVVQQMQGETTHVVSIVPTQSTEQCAKPSYKMVRTPHYSSAVLMSILKLCVKTYTRRGRGRCLNPGCSFVYVTRHKPPKCPECGTHLAGKWVPATTSAPTGWEAQSYTNIQFLGAAAKKTQEKETTSNQLPQKAEAMINDSCQATAPPVPEGNADVSAANVTAGKKVRPVQRRSKTPRAVPAKKPPEGGSTEEQEQTIAGFDVLSLCASLSSQVKDSLQSTSVQGPDRSNAAVQKRPVRPILPAYYNTGAIEQTELLANVVLMVVSNVVPLESFSGLKPSTLKQLGQALPASEAKQDSSVPAGGSQSMCSLVVLVSAYPFLSRPVGYPCSSLSFKDLGLSTARGRGRCKNPTCDYMYKNRHKPAVCPKCGCELTQRNAKGTKVKAQSSQIAQNQSETLLDPYQELSSAQKDIQRQNTLQLLHGSMQIPEGETELREILTLIQELNSLQIVLVQPCGQEHEGSLETETLVESGWPQFYESAATHCGLCNYPLFKGDQSTVAGQEDCWLLTETLIQTATLQLKVCLNVQCLALHSFTDLHPGLFNVGNRLLVSIDLFLKMRTCIKQGRAPPQAARTILDNDPNHPVHSLSPEETAQIQELLLSGYWAFECLTVRDYNDMICGVCGVAPKLEIAQRYTTNVLELKNVEFTWPEFSVSDEVLVDDFWLTMESEAIEQAAFPADIPVTRVDASIIAPFIPPLMRSPAVINTEKNKVVPHTGPVSGDPSVLVRLIHDGQLRLDKIEDHSENELRTILDRCAASVSPDSTKKELLASLISLYTLVHGGLSTAPPPPPHLTAGKLSKVCPHKVVCGSKYLVRGETARDHVDLLLSSRYWPPVYVSDCPRQVALCADVQYPEQATQMWGRNQGCFSDPFEKPEFVSCAELQEQPYSADLSLVAENQQVHPITKSSSCWLVHPPAAAQERPPPSSEHHSMVLCRDLEPHVHLLAELEKEGRARRQPVVFNNTAHYYLYNRLVDFLTSRDIVNQQINQVVKACQLGEVVIRDALYRLGVAQINTEREEDEGSGAEGQTQE
uniref:HMG box domain containing 3 n=1 Tax=Gasterosteus aculeatus TaxID=69293 RepID=G3Q1Q1_GASAC